MSDRETTETVSRDRTEQAASGRGVEDRLLDVHASDSDAYDGPVAEVVEVVDDVDEDGTVTVRFRLPSGHTDEEQLSWPASPDVDAKLNRLIDNDRLPFDEQSFSTETLYGVDIPVRQTDRRGNDWEIRVPDDSLAARHSAIPDVDLPDIERPGLPEIDGDGYTLIGWGALAVSAVGILAGIATGGLTVPVVTILLSLMYVGIGVFTRALPDVELKAMVNLLIGILGVVLQWSIAGVWASSPADYIGIAALLTALWIGCGLLHHRVARESRGRRHR